MCKYKKRCMEQLEKNKSHVEQALFIGEMICSLLDIKKEKGQDTINLN